MKNNNLWSQLTNPITNRPGCPAAPRQPCADIEAKMPARVSVESMPPEQVELAHASAPTLDPWHLSGRQMQVLDLLVQGASIRTIAGKLSISISTVSQHIGKMRERMGVATNGQAVVAWHRYYRVLYPDSGLGEKDSILIENLKKACAAMRVPLKDAA